MYKKLSIAILILNTFCCNAQADEKNNLNSSEVEMLKNMTKIELAFKKTEIENISFADAGKKPLYYESDCITLTKSLVAKKTETNADQSMKFDESNWSDAIDLKEQDTATVNQLLLDSQNKDAYQLFRLLPRSVMWWIRINKRISLISLATAIHETVHDIETLLRSCGDGNSTYIFNSHAWKIELRPGNTVNFSIAEESIPEKFKMVTPANSNFNTYIIQSKNYPGNDILNAMDEFNAYTLSAKLETDLTSSIVYEKLKTGGLDFYSGNIAGMSDFMLYTLCYLKVARARYPLTYKRIKNSPLMLAHLTRLWGSAENILDIAYKFTLRKGGIYSVNSDLIYTIYLPEFISELDQLGVQHAELANWNKTYFYK